MRSTFLRDALATLALLLSACTDEGARCVPGMASACACTDGAQGAQTCAADGTYGACVCDRTSPDGSSPDGSSADASPRDASSPDASSPDGSSPDGSSLDAVSLDASARDASSPDASIAMDGATDAGGLTAYVTEAQFEAMFPHRGDTASGCNGAYYTWQAFLEAARAFPAFANEGSDAQRRRELAAFLANIAHETTGGWATAPGGPEAWGLCFREELGCSTADPPACAYCVPSAEWPCASGRRYYGRGPIQLSYNFNYGQAGRALGVDLLNQPERVATDGVIAFKTALWFWMTAQSPKPSCHDAMTGRWTPSATDLAAGRRPGFGVTINIINGGLECGYARAVSSTPPPANVADRLRFYASFTARLGVSQGDDTACGTMQPW